MSIQRKRARAGDVLLLKVAGGVAYLHYLGRHSVYGDAVLVSRRFDEAQAAITDETFSEGYVTFYPVTAAVAQNLVEVVSHRSPPRLPSRLRRAGARSGRRVDTWIIEDGGKETVKMKLSDEDWQLPIAAIWNHEFLAQRVAEGWHPAQERGLS